MVSPRSVTNRIINVLQRICCNVQRIGPNKGSPTFHTPLLGMVAVFVLPCSPCFKIESLKQVPGGVISKVLNRSSRYGRMRDKRDFKVKNS